MSYRNDIENQPAADLESIIVRQIAPLLPGSRFSGPYLDQMESNLPVCFDTRYKLRLYSPRDLKRYYVFDRLVPFVEEERVFVERILDDVRAALRQRGGPARELADAAVRRAVAGHAAPECAPILEQILKTYENLPASGAQTLGIYLTRTKEKRGNFFELAEKGLLEGLGSGQDTLLALNAKGGVMGVETVPPTAANQEIMAPLICANIAAWANSRRKVAVRLSEKGQILVFARKRLLFVKHAGQWHCLPHTLLNLEPLPSSVEGVSPETLRAIYFTALDMSARSESATGQIWICYGRNAQEKKTKAGLLESVFCSREFPAIPRAVRQEICALGGRLLLDGAGNILGLEQAGQVSEAAPSQPCGENLAYSPGRGYMELVNGNGQSSLRLNFC